jgi:hypothetical protein
VEMGWDEEEDWRRGGEGETGRISEHCMRRRGTVARSMMYNRVTWLDTIKS